MGRLCEERESVYDCFFAPHPLPRHRWLMRGPGNAFAVSQSWLPQILAADPSVQGYSQGSLGCRRSSYSIPGLEYAVASSKASRASQPAGTCLALFPRLSSVTSSPVFATVGRTATSQSTVPSRGLTRPPWLLAMRESLLTKKIGKIGSPSLYNT